MFYDETKASNRTATECLKQMYDFLKFDKGKLTFGFSANDSKNSYIF